MQKNKIQVFYQNENGVNETELKIKEDSSSDQRSDIIFYVENIPAEQTVESAVLIGEIPQLKSPVFSYTERLILQNKVKSEQNKLDILVGRLTKSLANALKYFSADALEVSYAENLALDMEKEYTARVLGEILQRIYIQYNDYPNILAGVCRILGRFELQEVMPWGPTMLIGMLVHKNETVVEYAVAVVENWADIELLPILRNLNCPSAWLRDYIDNVVEYLEECYVLHKKII